MKIIKITFCYLYSGKLMYNKKYMDAKFIESYYNNEIYSY